MIQYSIPYKKRHALNYTSILILTDTTVHCIKSEDCVVHSAKIRPPPPIVWGIEQTFRNGRTKTPKRGKKNRGTLPLPSVAQGGGEGGKEGSEGDG